MNSTINKSKIVCFGEVLFDVFPTHTKIGGAPLNVGLRLASLGIETQIISRIGQDAKGKELIDFIERNDVSTAFIQTDSHFSTGEVTVKLDEKGSAFYTINYPVAWDKIEATPEAHDIVSSSDAVVFGSLVCRDTASYQSLLSLLNVAKYKIFDVNLRAPFYTKELLSDLMNKADFIKFNDDELYEISEYLGSPYHSLEQNMQFIAEKTNTQHICVTKGSHGAVLFYNNQLFYNSGYKITVADTVGAGDSFLAGLLSKLLTGIAPQEAINFACALGALVAQEEGANPKISKESIRAFMQ
jgi:fructokinase